MNVNRSIVGKPCVLADTVLIKCELRAEKP